MGVILTTEEFRAHTAGNCGCCQDNAECADVPGSDGCCHDADDRRHSLMTISEWESGCDCHTMMRHDAALRSEVARLTRERDEAREERDRARRDHEGACRLMAKMHHAARGAVTGPARGVVEDVAGVRARLLAAESRAERLEAALRASVVAMKRWSAEEDGLPVAPIGAHEAVAAAESIVGYVWAGWGPDPTRAALGEEGK